MAHDDPTDPGRINTGTSFACATLAASLLAVGFFFIAWAEDRSVSEQERLQLIEMTNSFVSVFSQNRGEGAPVPATFRRLGIEHFTAANERTSSQYDTSVRMPGLPGFELGLAESDPRLTAVMSAFAANPEQSAFHESRFENDRLVGRTIVPSIASSESCVTCHNEVLRQNKYQIGDVMGTYIVERDLTDKFWKNLQNAILLFAFSLIVIWLLATRERNRNVKLIRLEARIGLEKMKSEAEAKEKFLLSHDTLTGLPNRKLFNDHLNEAFEGAQSDTLNAALIDLDGFKGVNDTMGHAAGDALLVEVAARLSKCVETEKGFVARLGGDEFAIIWEAQQGSDDPSQLAEMILKEMKAPLLFEQWEILPKCSIGIAELKKVKSELASDLLKAADAALYLAKERGKDTFQIYDKDLDNSINRQNTIAAGLRESIQDRQMRIVLQPKVCLHDGRFKGFETLSRWCLNGEEISPEEYVNIAENTGAVRDLDLSVLEEAAKFSVALEAETDEAVPIAVNLSANSFRTGPLQEEIQDILWSTGLAPNRLTVEITETAAIENWELVHKTLGHLRQIGTRTALDDFGTGYSSLAYLLRMKFDEIKIDGEFVKEIEFEYDRLQLLQHISAMSESLGMDLVIEGIETQEQANLLNFGKRLVGQGYLFSKPMELENARSYFHKAIGRQAEKARRSGLG
ncbi:signal transduction protein containing a membrane domain an EAL and a GGDEF domain-like [Roseobacter sp. SK209-2-6]|uniref:putative bifunctional diguanylate cyclase/phosphodiesterase n=1 Tax=Roseobacter sp. SK209-2-6 TaxID=388739 RepID=UPI0000F3D6E0|nr:EAL domain-containing protein [Roseobacter sp. SK209-2-6]EBA17330.1 signal transduction protein containing a membrane domain an EAL and a GGDEF domain-like [Roseobacter sp. SK209-2-6]